jgi:pimeloyl-ACP methyl ester carboxylesterase
MEADLRHLRLRTGITVPCLIRDNIKNHDQDDAGAPPVLLLHAWGESRKSFDRLIPLLTVAHPEKVAALVLVGSPQSLQGRPAFADEVNALTGTPDEAWVRNSLSWFPLLHDVPAWYMKDRVRDGLAMPAHAWKGILNGLCEAVPPTETGTVRAPTLILYGAEDNLLPRSGQETMAARIPGAVLTVYPGVAHVVLWECPEQVARDTAAFLRTLT